MAESSTIAPPKNPELAALQAKEAQLKDKVESLKSLNTREHIGHDIRGSIARAEFQLDQVQAELRKHQPPPAASEKKK